MIKRNKHFNKEIEEAIQYAEHHGWTYKSSGKSSHAWRRLLCPLQSREGHQMSIWSTPKNTFYHAEQIRRFVDRCEHTLEDKTNENE